MDDARLKANPVRRMDDPCEGSLTSLRGAPLRKHSDYSNGRESPEFGRQRVVTRPRLEPESRVFAVGDVKTIGRRINPGYLETRCGQGCSGGTVATTEVKDSSWSSRPVQPPKLSKHWTPQIGVSVGVTRVGERIPAEVVFAHDGLSLVTGNVLCFDCFPEKIIRQSVKSYHILEILIVPSVV